MSAPVAVDEHSVYTVVEPAGGPISLVALDRDTGAPQWHTVLPGATTSEHAAVVLHDGVLAARSGNWIFVIHAASGMVPP